MTRHELKTFLVNAKAAMKLEEQLFQVLKEDVYYNLIQDKDPANLVLDVISYHYTGKKYCDIYDNLTTPKENANKPSGWSKHGGFIPDKISDLIFGLRDKSVKSTLNSLDKLYKELDNNIMEFNKGRK